MERLIVITTIATGIATHVVATRSLALAVSGLALTMSLALATTTTALSAHHGAIGRSIGRHNSYITVAVFRNSNYIILLVPRKDSTYSIGDRLQKIHFLLLRVQNFSEWSPGHPTPGQYLSKTQWTQNGFLFQQKVLPVSLSAGSKEVLPMLP